MSHRVRRGARRRRAGRWAAGGTALALTVAFTGVVGTTVTDRETSRQVEVSVGSTTPVADKWSWDELEAVYVWEDARATAKKLEELGFAVTWELAEEDASGQAGPDDFRPVQEVPADAQLNFVRDSAGGYREAEHPKSDTLVLYALVPEERVGTLEEVFPEALAVIDKDDPQATAAALDRLRMKVTWHLVAYNPDSRDPKVGERFTEAELDAISPTTSEVVAAPPAGTVIISVLSPTGMLELTAQDRKQRHIGIELIAADDAAALGH